MTDTARGTFDIELEPAPAELDGAVSRFDFRKTFHGDFVGTGSGVMLSCGDPSTGEAGYVAIEIASGRLDNRNGRFALQQLGSLHGGSQDLHYLIVPGSGEDALKGITGALHLTIEADGAHSYQLEYNL